MEVVEPDNEHLDEDLALDVLAGRIAPARTAAIDAHLDRCNDCRRFMIHLARLSEHRATAPGHGDGVAPVVDDMLSVGARVDRYVIEGLLGAGAMGMVYVARDPELDRRVAIKLLRPGSFTADARERMAREARTLARLSHPNVVAVHDVGPHGDAMFIVMELVVGTTLRRWLAAEQRDWRAIVHVLVRAGHGIAAAHAAGLVHRDFKPDNMMIADDGRVLVADFGLARPAGDSAPPADAPSSGGDAAPPEITASGAAVGTPAYMSPEQFAGGAGAAADQFAFCVTLYEALYRRRPFAGQTPAALFAAITAGEVQPPPPATRVPARIARILARGLRADPAARFPDMPALLAELTRDPARRARRIGLATLALAGAVAATWAVTRATAPPAPCGGGNQRVATVWNAASRDQVRAAFARAGKGQAASATVRTEAALDAYAGAWLTGYRDACEATHLRGDQSGALLDRRMACLDGRLAELDALVRLFADADAALIERAVGAVAGLARVADCADTAALDGMPAPADPAARQAAEAARADLARARTMHNAGKYTDEEPITRDVAARARALAHPPLLAAALYELGRLEEALGHGPEALAAFDEARLAAETAGNDRLKAELAISIANVAAVVLDRDEAARMDREAEAIVARLGSPPALSWLLADGKAKRAYGVADYATARTEFERALAIARSVFPAESYEIANLLNAIAVCTFSLGEPDRARELHEQVRAMRVAVLGPDHPALAETLQNLGNCHLMSGDSDEALTLYRDAIAILERSLGADHQRVAAPHHNLGMLYLMQGDFAASAEHARRAYEILLASVGPRDPQTARSQSRLAVSLAKLGELAEAKAHAAEAVAVLAEKIGADHAETAIARLATGDVLFDAGEYAPAAESFRVTLPVVAGTPNEEYALYGLGRCEIELGDGAQAAEHLARAIVGAEQLHGKDAANLMSYHLELGRAHLVAGRADRAQPALERALEIDNANAAGTLPALKGRIRFHLARALWSRPAERRRALALAEEARGQFASIDPAPREMSELRAWSATHRVR
jgi:tetratricopeptide (TPR) repeat protein